MSETERHNGDAFPWHLGVCDAHCHPTDTLSSMSSDPICKARYLTAMATRAQDQHLVDSAAKDHPETIIPCFGWHPWFAHLLYDDTSDEPTYAPAKHGNDEGKAKEEHYRKILTPNSSSLDIQQEFIESLPSPTPLSDLISQTREYLLKHPTALVGEIGLDKAFRLPQPWSTDQRDGSLTPGGREGRPLSPYRVRVEHQIAILRAQLHLAGELRRGVSVHGVQVHGVLLDAIAATWKGHERVVLSKRQMHKITMGEEEPPTPPSSSDAEAPKPFPPRICLHSYSASVEVLKQWLDPSIPADIYFSFSVAVNLSTKSTRNKIRQVIQGVPEERILVESDLHKAGEDMESALVEMYTLVCETKGWTIEDGVKRIRQNYEAFIGLGLDER
ncbi:TatD family [Emericellopsis atlantica]|uniref:TatD family n=1 Tax=Emericellopsis atlantica TaxID=2614577 RepID=A0A9P7ZRS7_9HYPO|nr:TatD family [Emericellopsis atlantica]KAG9256458.1 TatD family [Emericellopsis atlantica]